MNNDSVNNNGAVVGVQQPVETGNIVTEPTPDMVPNIVANPTPEIVNSNTVVNSGVVAPVASVPTVDTTAVGNTIVSDVNSAAVTSVNPTVTIAPATDPSLNVVTPVGDTVSSIDNSSVINENVNVGVDEQQSTVVQTGETITNQVTDSISGVTPDNSTIAQADATSTTSVVDSNDVSSDNIVSVGKYMGYLFLFTIPVVGFIMIIVKAVNKKDKNIANFAKAILVYALIFGVISGVIGVFAYSSNPSIFNNAVNSSDSSDYFQTTDSSNDYDDTQSAVDFDTSGNVDDSTTENVSEDVSENSDTSDLIADDADSSDE